MRILSADEMRQVDRRAIEEIGIPSLVLMENAAVGVADALGERFPQAAAVTVFCGPGNNGGDGLALARHLEARGYRYRVFLVCRKPPRGDAATQLEILERSAIEVETVGPESDLAPVLAAGRASDLVVDALFGTGLTRALEGHYGELVKGLDRLPVKKLAVDLPSGLDGSRPQPPGPHLTADLTVTFAAPKIAHVLPPAAEAVGELVVTDLGIPPHLVAEAPGDLHLLTGDELAATLAVPEPGAHKGDFGHVLLVAGSPGKAGAAILGARSAVRGGAGLVTAAVPRPILQTVDGGSLESMTLPLAAGPDGGLAAEAAAEALQAAAGKQAVAIGPGLGTAPATAGAVRRLLAELAVPAVVDADALNALAGHLGELRDRPAATVLTPHPGEMGRLLGIPTREVQADRLQAARRAADESGAVVVLKGYRTVVADPEGGVYVNPTGNAGMATGGSGDVLTGLLAALVGQGYEPLVASQLAVYLHGLAGDVAAETLAPETLRAGDLVAALPAAFDRLRAGGRAPV
jgi:NAD(P)H-hydrate epimerase